MMRGFKIAMYVHVHVIGVLVREGRYSPVAKATTEQENLFLHGITLQIIVYMTVYGAK